KGGTLLELTFVTRPTDDDLKALFASLGHSEATPQGVAGGVEVRTTEMLPDELAKTAQALQDRFGPDAKVASSSVVSPSFSVELIQNAIRAIALSSLLIVLLIAWAFRNFGWSAFRYGLAAIVSLLHDAAVVLGIFLFGGYSGRNSALALLIGIISGTYSSIFNASQIISLWQEVEDRLRHRALTPAT